MSTPRLPGQDDVMAPTAEPELETLVKENAGSAAPHVLRCRTVTEGHFRQLNYVRDLPPYAIEQRLGPAGDDAVPTPAEALLSALGSCVAVGIHANALARGIPIRSLRLDLEADFDPSAVWGVVNVNPERIGFNAVRIVAHIEADVPRTVLDALLAHVVLWSPVSNTIYNPVHIEAAVA
jgi:uncharacterized OsmC-like protein